MPAGSAERTRVLLADPEPLVRMGSRTLLAREDDMSIVGEAADGVEAVDQCRALKPDVIVLDVSLPRLDGLAVLDRLRSTAGLRQIRSVVLTAFDDDESVLQALQKGASGYLVKDGEPRTLLEAIRAVRQGCAYLAPAVTRRVIGLLVRTTGLFVNVPGMASLTEREREVVALAAAGQTNDEIAGALAISAGTVRTHVARAMCKLDVHDRAHLVAVAYRTGLVCFKGGSYGA